MDKLFSAYDLAGQNLPNRVVMAPMTRSRAPNGLPDMLTARYYSQRASAGLIISEGIAVSPQALGYVFTPGLYSADQVEAWKQVTKAVHAKGGRIFAQLWHVGRVSHSSVLSGERPVSSVARVANGSQTYGWVEPGLAGQVATEQPRALEIDEVEQIVGHFVAAGLRAVEAGFDGVEVQGGNGYLFDQFLNGGLNTRSDRYGGSIENRLRLILQTVDGLSQAIGARNVGVRISPFARHFDLPPFVDENETWLSLAAAFGKRELAYVHLSDQQLINDDKTNDFFADFRSGYPGALIVAGGFDQASAEATLRAGKADLVAFGTPFIANPDLVDRMINGWTLAQADRETFYGLHGARGYTDYPTYADEVCTGSINLNVGRSFAPGNSIPRSTQKLVEEVTLTDARVTLGSMRDDFFAAWSRAHWQGLGSVTTADAQLISNQHGEGQGADDWARMLGQDAFAMTGLQTSNHAIQIAREGQAAASAYVFGLFNQGAQNLLFGATVVLGFQSTEQGEGWTLTSARINVNWCKGDFSLVSHWLKPPSDSGWELGDLPPVIVSELDSPWALVSDPLPYPTSEDALRELYSKYAFAIDQGDIALLSDCYTDDVAGGFAPMGALSGRHAIVGQLKSFRRLWPWMQHFAEVVRIELEPDGKHARMIVARIIPERPMNEAGLSLYGAHYQIQARRTEDGQWRICWSDYRPGWFSAAQLPAFDIGVTNA